MTIQTLRHLLLDQFYPTGLIVDIVHVYGTCIWYMYMVHVYGTCIWYMYMVHVYAKS